MENNRVGEAITDLFVESALNDELSKNDIITVTEELRAMTMLLNPDDSCDERTITTAILFWSSQYGRKDWVMIQLLSPLLPILSVNVIESLLNVPITRPKIIDLIIPFLGEENIKEQVLRCLDGGISIPNTIKKLPKKTSLNKEISDEQILDRDSLHSLIADGLDINHVDDQGNSFWGKAMKLLVENGGREIPPYMISLNLMATTITIEEIIDASRYPFIRLPSNFDTNVESYRDEKGRNLLEKLVEEVNPLDINHPLMEIIMKRSQWIKKLPNLGDIILTADKRKLPLVSFYLRGFIA